MFKISPFGKKPQPLQGFNVLSNEARAEQAMKMFGSPLEQPSRYPNIDRFLKEHAGNNNLLTKRNALIAAGVALLGVATGAIAKHIHNKKA